MKKSIILTALIAILTGTAALADEPNPAANPCKYNEFDGMAKLNYRRLALGPGDWYSKFKEILICDKADGTQYAITLEELIRNFRVRQLPIEVKYLGAHATSGLQSYSFAGDMEKFLLVLSADNRNARLLKAREDYGWETIEMYELVPNE